MSSFTATAWAPGMAPGSTATGLSPQPHAAPHTLAVPAMALDALVPGRRARIHRIDPAAAGQPADRAGQLADIGFTAGETVTVLARAWPGGDPLVVRVGPSRFALRRAEAACVQVLELP